MDQPVTWDQFLALSGGLLVLFFGIAAGFRHVVLRRVDTAFERLDRLRADVDNNALLAERATAAMAKEVAAAMSEEKLRVTREYVTLEHLREFETRIDARLVEINTTLRAILRAEMKERAGAAGLDGVAGE